MSWFLIAAALALGILSLAGDRRRAAYIRRRLAERIRDQDLPPATVIVPVKGQDQGLARNLASLAALDYPDYELIVAARNASDVPPDVIPPGARVVLAGAGNPDTGEKINNLLAGVSEARANSAIFAFADSDGRVPSGWLRALAAPLAEKGVGAATGYRWHLPETPGFWPLVRSAWNAVIAGSFGPGDNGFVWGGAMAIRKEAFYSTGVPELWKGAVSDDFRLAEAVRRAGLDIAYAPGAMVASTDGTRGVEFLKWIQRQMIITRVYNPRLWWIGFVAHAFYCGAMAACVSLALELPWAGTASFGAIWLAGACKARNRMALMRSAMTGYETWFDRHGWFYGWSVPLVTWIWLYSFAASAYTSTIEWRGYRYKLNRTAGLWGR